MKKTTVRARFIGFINLAVFGMLFSFPVHAFTPPPACLETNGQVIPVIDDQVIKWKTTTPNQYLARAHISGIIQKLYPMRSGHAHFSIKIGPAANDTIEVIYNVSFGALPTLAAGMQVETCGDYITSTAQSGSYQASPDGAIIHWIHKAMNNRHLSGYLAINGVTYGLLNGNGN